MTKKSHATAIGSISIVLWGALALFTALTAAKIPSFQLMAMTFAIAFLLMSLRWWRNGESGIRYIRQPSLAWLIGVGAYFGYHYFYFEAMSKAPAAEVSMLAYLWPLLIVVFETLRPGEKFSLQLIAGALMALAGCWLLLRGDGTEFNTEHLAGYLLALVCAFIWSGYSVAGKLVKQVPTDAVGWFCAVTALLALGCHLTWETTVWPSTTLEWVGVIGLGIGPVGIAFFTWDYGIKHGDVSLLGVLAYSAPLISVLLLILVGITEPDWVIAVAAFIIVGGSLLAGLSRFKPA